MTQTDHSEVTGTVPEASMSDATAAAEKASQKADTRKVVPPPTKEELQELREDYIVLCTKSEVSH